MRQDNRDLIASLEVPSGSKKRFDCPECGGNKTLSVTNAVGKRMFNCYKAGCGFKGVIDGSISCTDIHAFKRGSGSTDYSRNYKIGVLHSNDLDAKAKGFVRLDPASPAGRYLARYRLCALSVAQGLLEAKYDVRENRLVFIDSTGGVAAGRTLSKGVLPKWKRYDADTMPFCIGNRGGVCVLVEDIISGASLVCTGRHTGIALLGTSLLPGFSSWLQPFESVIVALDKDASGKALKMQAQLQWYKPTRVVLLERDLKYLTKEEIENKLKV